MRKETIEDYLKTIYNLSSDNTQTVTNKQLSLKLGINPASVTEAVRKLHDLKYVVYEKSYGTRLTASGARLALGIVRRHRIWETYLVNVLGFGWDEVHEIAEELEHVGNDKLINKLASLLSHPSYDPHGDPIPDEKLNFKRNKYIRLSEARPLDRITIMGVNDHSNAFLKYLEKNMLVIGRELIIRSVEEVDGTLTVINRKKIHQISPKVAEGIFVKKK